MGTWALLVLSTCFHIVAASSCFYFAGPDFSDQMLVIKRELEKLCDINKTTAYGVAVPCAGNATAARVNSTHVLLKANPDPHGKFIMEYGKDSQNGNITESFPAECPDPASVSEKVEKPDGNNRVYYVLFASVVPVMIVSGIIIIIFQNHREKKKLQSQSNGHGASYSNGSCKLNMKNGDHMNGTGPV